MHRAAVALLVAALVPPTLAAQLRVSGNALGRVSGTVMNTKGKALPGTTVTLSGDAPELRRTAVTDKKGSYRFDDVPEGRYTVTAELETFVTMTRPAVVNEAARNVTLRFFLNMADQSATVPDRGRAPRPVLNPFPD